jgi:hypothetical protein
VPRILLSILLFVIGWSASRDAFAQPAKTIAVIDAVKFPAKATQAHDRLLAALEDALKPKDWSLAGNDRRIPDCGGSPACMAKVAADTSTGYVLRISGQKIRDIGYDVSLELFTTAAGYSRNSHVACDICDPDRMSEIAAQSAVELLNDVLKEEASLRARAKQPSVAATPSVSQPPADITTPPPIPPEPSTSRWVPWTFVGVGLAAVGYGIVALIEDGKGTGPYSASPAYEVRDRYSSKTIGIISTTAGGLLAIGGGFWLYKTYSSSASVAVSPSHIALNVRF